MQESILFSSACTMSSYIKFTFAISSAGEFLVCYVAVCLWYIVSFSLQKHCHMSCDEPVAEFMRESIIVRD